MSIVLDSRGTPGYEFFVDSAGPTIPAVAVYSRLYLLIHVAGTPPTAAGLPVAVGSMDDFTNLFGSASALILDSIECYLQNFSSGLYVVRAVPSAYTEVTVVANAGAKTLTINGTQVSITPDASPTLQEVITALVNAVNDNEAINLAVEAEYVLTSQGQPNYAGGKFRLRGKAGTFTVTAGGTGVTVDSVTTPALMQYWDWMGALRALGDRSEDEPLGFLACPQAFHTLTNQFERTQVGNTMEEVCRRLGWFGYIDPFNPATIDHPYKAKTDAAGYIATQGHTAYTYPYFINRDNDLIAPSVAIPAVALRRYQRRGIQEPPAGQECVLNGVSGVQFTLNTAQRVDLAEANVNINIFQPGWGAMPYDTLTRSTDPAFLMINARIILSSFERTLRDTLRASRLLHRSVDSAGRFYSLLGLTVTGVADLFYQARALYGASPGQAYYVRCNAQMQGAVNLERGIVVYEVYLVPVPTARRIKGYLYRVAIDQMAQTVAIEAL